MSDSFTHSTPEPAALVELATAVGQWLGAENVPVDVIHTQERVVAWAKELIEQLEALQRTLLLADTALGVAYSYQPLTLVAEARSAIREASSPASRESSSSWYVQVKELKEQLDAAREALRELAACARNLRDYDSDRAEQRLDLALERAASVLGRASDSSGASGEGDEPVTGAAALFPASRESSS